MVSQGRTMRATADDKRFSILGMYLRPLLSEAGTALGMPKAGFIGICFPNPEDKKSRVCFAEYLNRDNRKEDYGDNVLLETSKFILAIDSAAENGLRHTASYTLGPDESNAVKLPLQKEFPGADSVNIYARRTYSSAEYAILYFVALSEEPFEAVGPKLSIAINFLVATLRDAIFLAATAHPEVGSWSDELATRLPEVFPGYTSAQKAALARVRHPYLQWLDDHHAEPRLTGAINSENDKKFLRSLRGFDEVQVKGLLSGSFQDHNVYEATVIPEAAALEFQAAIKSAPQGRADMEIRGYFSLLPYFRNIRDLMPAAPLSFPTDENNTSWWPIFI